MFFVYMSVLCGLPKLHGVCLPNCDPSEHCTAALCIVAPATPLAIQKLLYCCAGAFTCQSPGAREWSICTDALTQSMQFHQTKRVIVIKDKWQVQRPTNAKFHFYTHPHTEKKEDWTVALPQTNL